jgi:hypothetical protein
MTLPRRKFWPYDEVIISRDSAFPNRFNLSSPWMKFTFDVNASQVEKAELLSKKLSTGSIAAEDIQDINWLFASLSKYPVSYILPSVPRLGADVHKVLDSSLNMSSPGELFKSLASKSPSRLQMENFIERTLGSNFTWDLDAALEFSQTLQGYDPESLFSVARRFHLLNDLEWNKTADLIEFVKSLKDDEEKFREASALIVRQNHYVTEKCDEVLRTALPISQSAEDEIIRFVEAEAGHDKLLAKALRSLGAEPSDVPAIDAVVALMEVFRLVAERNLLAFAMVVDIFERSSYRKEDPLTSLLNEGGQSTAAHMADVHREINDAGEHENVALGFLAEMASVDGAYAREALRLAELATLVIHQLSSETLRILRN